MALSTGARLGPYEILGPLGAGGMGEVYRARDTRLDRTVALKVLAAAVASQPTLRARFEREARAIAALEHPHICTLHDVGEENGQAYLVMEHLGGETLADRLSRGPLSLPHSLEVAIQIAEGLAAAHKHGIVHRDLKPGNVMLTQAGVKLLDFGLARLTQHAERPVVEELTEAPTRSGPLTGTGMILGTLPYMAPEQLEGKPADPRTDLWSLGAIVYEMVSGRRAFQGSSQVSLIAAIVEREPASLCSLQPLTPPSLERLVKRCLAKSPDDRWQSAHDVADELRWIGQVGLSPAGTIGGRAAGRWPWAVGGLALVAGILLGASVGRRLLVPASARPAVVRTLLDVGPAEQLAAGGRFETWLRTPGGSRTALAWTPDGRSLVFVGRQGGVQRLYVRALDGEEARVLEGTEGAQGPVVSPDGSWVVFWASGAIRRVPLTGGPVAVVVDGVAANPTGIACGGDGRVFYDADRTIWAAEPERPPAALTRKGDTEVSHVLPHLLPGGRALLYTVRHSFRTWGDEEVFAHLLTTGEDKRLLRDAVDARYVASGHLVFLRRGTLFGVGFDLARLEVVGTPVAMNDAMTQALTAGSSGDMTGAGQFSVGLTGSLAYVRGPVIPHADFELVAIDRSGRVTPLGAPTRSYAPVLDLSPGGRHLAVLIESLTEAGLWIYDRERGTLSKLTPGGEVWFPRWTPDGTRVAFGWVNQGVRQLAWQRADGTGGPEVLARDTGWPSSWSPNGKLLALATSENKADIFIASIEDGTAAVRPLMQTPELEHWPDFSPDGGWLAYGSKTSGRFEVYVQPYPGPAPRQQVSLAGGESPAWSPTGRELFFLSPADPEGTRQMMAVDVHPGPTLSLGSPRRLFSFSEPPMRMYCQPSPCYAVAPDGQQFYTVREAPAAPIPPVTQIHLVLNWTEELRARVPSGTGR